MGCGGCCCCKGDIIGTWPRFPSKRPPWDKEEEEEEDDEEDEAAPVPAIDGLWMAGLLMEASGGVPTGFPTASVADTPPA